MLEYVEVGVQVKVPETETIQIVSINHGDDSWWPLKSLGSTCGGTEGSCYGIFGQGNSAMWLLCLCI